ncbi:MAG: histidine phosphatase family protein [Proteobacteria bacterium]|nr:histidine phosphatase family protein [Pseudomonadota bacterium]
MTAPTRLFLLRHAEVETRYHRVFGGGRIDMELSPRGHEQALALATWLRRHQVDAVVASPMKRVQQTLAPLDGHCATPHHVAEGLREVDFGDWTGFGWADLKAKFGVSAYDWLDHLEAGAIPNGESAATLRARVEPCVREIIRTHHGRNVAVYCHGGVVRMLLSILLELPLPKFSAFDIDYASVTQVELHPEKGHKPEVRLLNFTPWRDLS